MDCQFTVASNRKTRSKSKKLGKNHGEGKAESHNTKLSIRPKAEQVPERSAMKRGKRQASGEVKLSTGMVDALSKIHGVCPKDHQGELDSHWEGKGGGEYFEVVVCRLNPSHRFLTGSSMKDANAT